MNAELARRLRPLASIVSVLVLLAVLAIGWIYSRVRASLPVLDGTVPAAGLTTRVTVERDALGVPTIKGATRRDVAHALGFLHAQDRFFQMDVWRRSAAGELSEIFGPQTLDLDRAMRRHGFRPIAAASVARLPANERAVLEAYAEGVNAGLAALREKPFEYLVMRADPEPWKPEDTFLVCSAMLVDLQDDTGRYEHALMTLRDALGASGVAFFAPLMTPDDAALDGSTAPMVPVPNPQIIDLRPNVAGAAPPAAAAARAAGMDPRGGTGIPAPYELAEAFAYPRRDPAANPGSNCFALAGAHTANGAALLASDIHLNLRVPNVWYRASLEYPGRKITGVTLPGAPLVIAGSNGRVAWGFTNAYVDTGDLIAIQPNPVSASLYRAPGHADLLQFETRTETIQVRGRPPVKTEYEWSIWGPIVGRDSNRRPLAYLWTGHDPDATNLALLGMEDATDVGAAIDVAHRTGMPPQNIVIADAAGDIAWTIAGRLPRRAGYDGRLPVTFQFGDRSWNGHVPPGEIPAVTTRPTGRHREMTAQDGRIWSANQRMIGGGALATLGDGGYARPNRAARIRDLLAHVEHATPRDLLTIQLDDRALFLTPWHRLLLDTLSPAATAGKPARAALRDYVQKWEGRASIDATSYPIVRRFRLAVYSRVFPAVFASCLEADPQMRWNQLLLEPALWTLIREKPMHLLDRQYASWDALLVAAVDDTIKELDRTGVRLAYATWGRQNAAEIRHPLSYTLPSFLRPWLDMPREPLPGDVDMPRVQTPTHGASERFVVAPGRENEGIYHMPCGQSGHPLSPFYRAGHEAWVRGDPTPFLPGKTEHTLVLEPPAR